MTNSLTVHPKVRICKRQFNFTGHKVLCPLLAFLPFCLWFQKISQPAIYILPLNIHNAKLNSSHLLTEESRAEHPAEVAAWLSGCGWQTGNLGSVPKTDAQSQLVVGGRETSLRTTFPVGAINSAPLFNSFPSYLTAIMLPSWKQYLYTESGGIEKIQMLITPFRQRGLEFSLWIAPISSSENDSMHIQAQD